MHPCIPIRWLRGTPRVVLILALLPHHGGLGSTASTNQTLYATISPIAKLSVPASVNMAAGATRFSPFLGTLPVNYRARSTPTGTGTVTVRVTSDFTPSGGPSTSAGALTYSCGAATLGTACSGTQTASTTVSTPVLTLPASA